MPSVIIPAHNESALIGACIESILADDIPDLEVVVVPNACSDNTADIARSFAPAVTVVETDTPGKTNALNLGEQHASTFPRAFVDGDIVFRPGSLQAVFQTLSDTTLIASPPPEFDTEHADRTVTLFYRALSANPYFGRGAPNGSGVFAVTQTGRARWNEFPEIIADDGYVHRLFAEQEAATADGPPAIVQTPRTRGALLKIKARARLGKTELDQKFPNLKRPGGSPAASSTITSMLARPSLWSAIPVYIAVRLAERRQAARMASAGQLTWLRDDTSRQSPAPGPTP